MSKDKLEDYDSTEGNNTDLGGTSILGTNNASVFDNMLRRLMAHMRTYIGASDAVTAEEFDLLNLDRLTSSDDLDSFGGLYGSIGTWINSSVPTNAPVASSTAVVLTLPDTNSGGGYQFCMVRQPSETIYWRVRTSSTWNSWSEITQRTGRLQLRDTQVVTATDATYSLQAGTTHIRVTCIGGGGGGGGCQSNGSSVAAAPGGNGGEWSQSWIDIATLSLSPLEVSLTIGAAGSGNSNADGDDGGDTTYTDGTNTIIAKGGKGGAAGSASTVGVIYEPTTPVNNSHGQVNRGSEPGHIGFLNNISSWFTGVGGAGGNSPMGVGGLVVSGFNTGAQKEDGNDGTGYGAGGSGCYSIGGSSVNATGGSGTQGVIIIEEFSDTD